MYQYRDRMVSDMEKGRRRIRYPRSPPQRRFRRQREEPYRDVDLFSYAYAVPAQTQTERRRFKDFSDDEDLPWCSDEQEGLNSPGKLRHRGTGRVVSVKIGYSKDPIIETNTEDSSTTGLSGRADGTTVVSIREEREEPWVSHTDERGGGLPPGQGRTEDFYASREEWETGPRGAPRRDY
jgi:hypothetical protein